MISARLLLVTLIAFCAFFSCARKAEPVLPQEGEPTLKAVITEKESAAQWTAEVSPRPATAEPRPRVALTPDTVFAFRKQTAMYVYPELAEFGFLDTSLIGKDARAVIDSFCKAVIAKNRTRAAALMNPQNTFLLSVFFYDARDLEFSGKFALGQAGMRGNLWQVPVRFFLKNGYTDAQLFFMMGESVLIDQISYEPRLD